MCLQRRASGASVSSLIITPNHVLLPPPPPLDQNSAQDFHSYLQTPPLSLARVSIAAGGFPATKHAHPKLKERVLLPPTNATPAALGSTVSFSEWNLAATHAGAVQKRLHESPPGLTVVHSPVTLRRRAVPDSGAAGCLLGSPLLLPLSTCYVYVGP
jgi:hypothetical protein